MNKQDQIKLVEESIEENSELFEYLYPWAKVKAPDNKEDKYQGGTIKNWWANTNEEGEVITLAGYIYGDDRWPDGVDIRTSYVVNLEYDEATETGVVETRNTVYLLKNRLKV